MYRERGYSRDKNSCGGPNGWTSDLIIIENFVIILNFCSESLGDDAARFSRSCTSCHKEPRGPRLIATACGHAVCRACAANSEELCPVTTCFEETTFLKLIEPEDGTRACPVCLCDAPVERCALRVCGHILCEACYHEIRKEAAEQGTEILCPLCRSGTTVGEKTWPIRLSEARIVVAEIEDDEEEEEREEQEEVIVVEEEESIEEIEKENESEDSDIEIIEEIVEGPSVKALNEQEERRRRRRKEKERDIEIVGNYGSTRGGMRGIIQI